MKLVIDIDDDIAQGIIDGENDAPRNIVRAFQATIADAIKKGTPLPKGHGNLIDRDALEYEIASIEGYSEYDYECVAREDIEQAPIIIKADTEEKEL